MTCICKSHAGIVAANFSYAAVSESCPRRYCNSSSLLFCANCDKNCICTFQVFCETPPERATPGDPFCGDIDGVPLGQRGVLPGPAQINCRAFRATRERSVPPLDPCCRERATLRTPSAVPRTHTHSYIKFGSHRKLEHILQLPKFVC